MAINRHLLQGKYFWIELGFLLFLTFGISIISDIEYSAYERHDVTQFTKAFRYRLMTGTLMIIPLGIYYWGFLKRSVFKRHVIGFILSTVAFILLFHFYIKFMHWVIEESKSIFTASKLFVLEVLRRPGFAVNVSFQLIRNILPLTGLAFWIRSLTLGDQMRTLKEQQLSSELKYLKAQLHPHFFFNTINNIYGLALNQSPNTAPMIARMGEMMRYILYEADQKTVSITKEIAFLSNYVEVEKIRHGQHIDIIFDVQGIQPATQVEPLLLLPFIENAFKHGLEQETARGIVRIILCQTEKELMLDIQNSKPATQAIPERHGIGLANVRKRLNLLYPGKHQLIITEEAGMYQAILTLQQA